MAHAAWKEEKALEALDCGTAYDGDYYYTMDYIIGPDGSEIGRHVWLYYGYYTVEDKCYYNK